VQIIRVQTSTILIKESTRIYDLLKRLSRTALSSFYERNILCD